jgi:hypothetical protein
VGRLLLYVNRRTGVAHVERSCEAIASVPASNLRLELFDPNRPRRRCSRCWSGGRPRSRALAGGQASVTERSEGNPRSGLTGDGTSATPATERAADGCEKAVVVEPQVGSSNTRPRAITGTPDDCGWRDGDDLRSVRGYVINRWTGEVLSSVIADVIREREDERGRH